MLTTLVPPGYQSMKLFTNLIIGVWSPTFFGWLSVVIFDSQEMRTLYHLAIHISVAGPFALYWLALGDLFVKAEWAVWGWYLWILIMLAYTVASICY